MSGPAFTCDEDWIALARRGALPETAWAMVQAHLRACSDCRVNGRLAEAFDGSAGAQPGDEVLTARVVEATLASGVARPGPVARRLPRVAVAAAASVVLAAAMASAGIALYRRGQEAAARSVVAAPPAPAAPVSVQPPPGTSKGHPAPGREPAPAPSVRTKRTRLLARADVAAEAGGTPLSPQAALFARATEARGAGRPGEAIALFRRLQREWPSTAEATVSLVSLGNLLAEAGQPDEALASFDLYLDKSPSGPLAEEALVARARLLARMGRADDARAARAELRLRFPRSAYGSGGVEP